MGEIIAPINIKNICANIVPIKVVGILGMIVPHDLKLIVNDSTQVSQQSFCYFHSNTFTTTSHILTRQGMALQ